MKVMIDNDLPFRLATALQSIFIDDEIISLREKFQRTDLKDVEWISQLRSEGGWSIISADRRITKNHIERNALLSAGIVGFFFSAGLKKAKIHDQAARLFKIWPDLRMQASLAENGCFEISANGKKFRSIAR